MEGFGMDSSSLRYRPLASYYEHGNEHRIVFRSAFNQPADHMRVLAITAKREELPNRRPDSRRSRGQWLVPCPQ
jgi:hypothetical protein